MIDLEKAKSVFDEFVKSYDLNDNNNLMRYEHTYRVVNLSKMIAESLKLDDEQVKLAQLIGLLHDVARFEQYKRYNTFSDIRSFDHGDYGVKILEENNFIREFLNDDKYDKTIKIAVKNHNKLKLEDGLSEEELLFARIVRDADKIDILYENYTMLFKTSEEKELIENGVIRNNTLNCIREKRLVVIEEGFTKIDALVTQLAFIFDFNFDFSRKYVKEQGYIEKILSQYEFKNWETKKKIEEIKRILLEEI